MVHKGVSCANGLLPLKKNEDGSFTGSTPADVRKAKAYVYERRGKKTPLDIVMEGEMPDDDPERAAAVLQPLAKAGVTCWLETMWCPPNEPEAVRARLRQGPPRHG